MPRFSCIIIIEITVVKIEFKIIEKIIITGLAFIMIIGVNGLIRTPEFLNQETPIQIEMANLIQEHASNDSPTLLHINSMDNGFYTAAGIIPQERFFHLPSLWLFMDTMLNSQKEAVLRASNEFIIIHSNRKEERPDEEHWGLQLSYRHIAAIDDAYCRYHLYQLLSD